MPESDGMTTFGTTSMVTRDTELRMRRSTGVNCRERPKGLRTDHRNAQSPLEVQKGRVEQSTDENCEKCEIRRGNSDLTQVATQVEVTS